MSSRSCFAFRVNRLRIALGSLGLLCGFVASGLAGPTRSVSASSIVYTGTSVIFTGTGLAPDGAFLRPVSARATFTIEPGNLLQVILENLSPEPTPSPAALLSSLYFSVGSGTNVPALTYASALGQVYQTSTTNPPVPGVFVPPASFTPGIGLSDLRAFNPGDRTWQFRDNLALVASSPPLRFGVGTVGNSSLSPNNFNGNIVDGRDFSIFVGAPQTANLANDRYVKDSVTFQFGGLGDFTLADIPAHVAFGFGTTPHLVSVPEPGGLALLAAGGLVGGLIWLARARRRRSRSGALPDGLTRCSLPAGLTRSLITTAIVTAVVIVLLVASGPVRADPVATFDFAAGPQNWVATNANSDNFPWYPMNTWAHSAPAQVWQVVPKAVLPPFWIANYLTSPLIAVPAATDLLEITIRHRFSFPVALADGEPIVLGQVVYRVFDSPPSNPFNDPTPFQPVPLARWETDPFVPPLSTPSTPSSGVLPTYLVPANRPPMITGGMAFSGQSPNFASNDFVVSRFLIDGGLSAGQQVQLRFINGNLDMECTGGRWDLSSVTVQGFLVPEPAGGVLAFLGIAGACGCLKTCRRRPHQRASRPSDSPCTNTPPPVTVA